MSIMISAMDINAKTPSHKDAEKIENVLAALIVDAAMEVHRTLGGPGLLESLIDPHEEDHASMRQADEKGSILQSRS